MPATARIKTGRQLLDALVDSETQDCRINKGVDALCDIVIPKAHKPQQSHNILFSHACAVGAALDVQVERANMARQINNFTHCSPVFHGTCLKNCGAFECRHYPAGARARIGRVSGADGGELACADRIKSGRTGRANPERDCAFGADRVHPMSTADKRRAEPCKPHALCNWPCDHDPCADQVADRLGNCRRRSLNLEYYRNFAIGVMDLSILFNPFKKSVLGASFIFDVSTVIVFTRFV